MKRSMSLPTDTCSYHWQPKLWSYARPRADVLALIVKALAQLHMGGGMVGITVYAVGVGFETLRQLTSDELNTAKMLVDFVVETHRQKEWANHQDYEEIFGEIH